MNLSLHTLVLRYTAFAVLATFANLATQRVVLLGGNDIWVYSLALFLGTATGLVVKYALDKRWIFGDTERSVQHHSRTFSLYTLMGVLTTAIFWGTQTTFWWIWQTDGMRELGAVLGLSVGYVVKYKLDQRYVFSKPNHKVTS